MEEINVLFVGGYPSPLLPNGLKTVNCGRHIEYKGKYYEIMGKDISNHNYNIVSKYFSIDSGGKAEFSCSISKETGEYQFGLAYYKNRTETKSHRFSRNIPKRYGCLKQELIEVHDLLFKGIWGVDWEGGK